MSEQSITPERLAAFSDGVFAVIITIMVLDLRPPAEATLAALVPLWPTLLSYAVSYLFIAIIWLNHHHLLRYAQQATPRLIWWTFAHLFMISLVPATTVWIAATRLAAAPVFVYAGVFVLINIAYLAFTWETLSQASASEVTPRIRRLTRVRSLSTLGIFMLATSLAFWSPGLAFGLVCCVLLIYLHPHVPGGRR
jgi:uncharacterized membrane protein